MGFQETFKALADPLRRDILLYLRKNGKVSAGELAQHFSMSNPAMSYHLNQLKKADLIYEEKQKNFIFYDINLSVFEEMIFWFEQFKGGNQK